MVALRLTEANLKHVKRELLRSYKGIKSSHLTEALAVAAGYRTHAALQTMISSAASVPVVHLDERGWLTRLDQLGYTGVEVEALRVAAQASDLPDRCWCEVKKGDSDGINEWFFRCREQDIPTIDLSFARKYVKLRWDCISMNSDRDVGVLGESARPLVNKLFATFQAHAKADPGKPMFEGNPFVGVIENLLPDTARRIAGEFFILLYNSTHVASETA